jgi:plastocyanin
LNVPTPRTGRPGGRRPLRPGPVALLVLALAAAAFTASAALAAPQPSLTITTAAQTLTAGQLSNTITVTIPSAAPTGGVVVALATSSTGGTFRNTANTATITSVTIAAGATSASFKYVDTVAGQPQITVSNANYKTDRQTETINPAALDHIAVSPATATITAGGSQAYTASGFDQYNNLIGDVSAATTFSIAPDGSCTGATCTATKNGSHTVTGSDGGKTATATLTVQSGPVASIKVSPKTATISVDGSQTYTATSFDQFGNATNPSNVTANTTFTISPDGSCLGATCSAGAVGPHTVTATYLTFSDTATLTVTAGALDHIVISPKSSSTTAGVNVTYTAAGFDSHGNSLGDVTSATSFSINGGGSCTANACGSTTVGGYQVTASDAGKTDTATLQVNAGAIASIKLSPASASISSGGSQAYSVEAFDQYGNDAGDVTGSSSLSISPNGSCDNAAHTCTAIASGAHTVTATRGGKTDTASLQVTSGALASIEISPASATIDAGGSQAYAAEGFDANGNSLGDVTAQTTFTISGSGSCQAASCGADQAGVYTVTGDDGGASDTASLTVTPGALASIAISPQAATVVAGDGQAYTAQGFDAHGNSLGDVTGDTSFSISPDGSCSGAVCTPSQPGDHTVTGTDGAASDSATLSVNPAAVDHIVISPASASIAAGESQAFSAEGFDGNGNDLGDVTADSTFSIGPDGSCTGNVCTATQAGGHTVTATDAGKSDQASLSVSAAAADRLVFGQQPSNADAGSVITPAPTVRVQDAYGNLVASSASITLSQASGPTPVNLAGTLTKAAADGVATFSDLTFAKGGTYTIKAASGTLASAVSQSFVIASVGADITIASQTVSPSPTANSDVSLTTQVKNNGPSSAANVVLTVNIPSKAKFKSVSVLAGSASCSGQGPVVCSIGTMAKTGTGTGVQVQTVFVPLASGTMSASSSITSDTTDTNTANNTKTNSIQVAADPSVKSYVSVSDSGFSPSSVTIGQGDTVQWNFYGPSAHSVVDNSGMGLFDSGLRSPVDSWRWTFIAAGYYTCSDGGGLACSGVKVTLNLPASGSVGTAFSVGYASAALPAGYVEDVQVQAPGKTTYTTIGNGVSGTSLQYTPSAAGTYTFRARLRNTANGKFSQYSLVQTVSVS